MQNLSMVHIISMLATLIIVALVGVWSGRRVKNSNDFSTAGKKASWKVVAGSILGTLVGAASTIGTAQLAFVNGLSGWWFTLGSSTGCLFLIFYSKRLWTTGAGTIPEIIRSEFGHKAAVACSIATCLSLVLSIVPQVIALSNLIASMAHLQIVLATFVAIALMASYVIFGGVWGAGLTGILKLGLIYFACMFGGYFAVSHAGGVTAYMSMLPEFPWYDIFGLRGPVVCLSGFISTVVGVVSTQTYIQAILSGRSIKASRVGALTSMILIPPIGFTSCLIGIFMRANHPDIASAQAFPLFILQYIDPFIGGIFLATILIATIGTGAGLTLGLQTVLTRDIYKKLFKPDASDKHILLMSRVFIVLILLVCVIFTLGDLKAIILSWTFMAMGLRGTSIFLPLLCALFIPRRINKVWAMWSMILGPLTALLWKFFGIKGIDLVYVGIAVAAICVVIGLMVGRKDDDAEDKDKIANAKA